MGGFETHIFMHSNAGKEAIEKDDTRRSHLAFSRPTLFFREAMLNDGDEPSPFAAAILSHVVGQTVTLVVFLLAGLTLHLFRDHLASILAAFLLSPILHTRASRASPPPRRWRHARQRRPPRRTRRRRGSARRARGGDFAPMQLTVFYGTYRYGYSVC